jgi:hypothetical protein
LLSLLLRPCSGFKWTIDEALDSMQILTLSERYMFASGEGPILLPQGDSYIDAKATVEFTSVASCHSLASHLRAHSE